MVSCIILCETYSLVLGLMHQDLFPSSQNEDDDTSIKMQKAMWDELPSTSKHCLHSISYYLCHVDSDILQKCYLAYTHLTYLPRFRLFIHTFTKQLSIADSSRWDCRSYKNNKQLLLTHTHTLSLNCTLFPINVYPVLKIGRVYIYLKLNRTSDRQRRPFTPSLFVLTSSISIVS